MTSAALAAVAVSLLALTGLLTVAMSLGSRRACAFIVALIVALLVMVQAVGCTRPAPATPAPTFRWSVEAWGRCAPVGWLAPYPPAPVPGEESEDD